MADPDIAIACCRPSPDAHPTELYPDPDSDLLIERLAAIGIGAEKVAWDNPEIDWKSFAVVIVRSTWDSVDRPEEYLGWVRKVGTSTTLRNPRSILEWNLDKLYLKDLAAGGVPTVPTQWVSPGDEWSCQANDFVLKPTIASGARSTARYSQAALAQARDHVTLLGEQGQTVMVQQYLPTVDSAGETSIIFLAGQPSHAVRKGGFLNLDEGIIERPWERMNYLGRCTPTPVELAVAEHALDLVQRRSEEPILYGRVDLLPGGSGQPLVVEVELIDPLLSSAAVPAAADQLAQAIRDLLRSRRQPG